MIGWRTIDIRPCSPGWRIWKVSVATKEAWSEPLVAFLVQEQGQDVSFDHNPWESAAVDYDVAPGDRRRRIVEATYFDGTWLMPRDLEELGEWCVLGPGQPDPSSVEITKEIEDRVRAHRTRVAKGLPE